MVYFEKSQPSPNCLEVEKNKKNGDYKCGDVLERIKTDFKNKCYICENNEPITINVEHFKPHKNNKELRFKWENLFWSCGHCNNIKHDKYDNLIDCTNQYDNVEGRIKLSMNPYPKEIVKIEALDNHPSTLATVDLLEAVYNGTTKLKTIEASNLRNKILKDIKEFQNYLLDYYSEGFDDEYKDNLLNNIKRHLKKSSNFTSFKRWIIRSNEVLKTDLEQYFD